MRYTIYMKFLLVTDGTWGDTLPFMYLAKELISQGHEAIVCSNEFYKDYSEAHQIPFVVTTTLDDRNKFLKDARLWDPQRGMAAVGEYAGVMFERTYPLLELLCKDAAAIITHSFAYAGKTCAEQHSIPHISLMISPIQLRSFYKLPTFYGEKNINWVPRIFKKVLYPLIDRIVIDPLFSTQINEYRTRLGLYPIKSFVHYMTQHPLAIGLWPNWYAPLQPDQRHRAQLVGFPLQVEIDTSVSHELTNWINMGRPPILVTMGSGYMHSDHLINVLKEISSYTLERFIYVGPQIDTLSEVHPHLYIASHVQLSSILPQCKMIIHHGGAGTLAQATIHGIPQLVIPLSHDQPDNASRIKDNGLGHILWNTQPDTELLNAHIQEVLHSQPIRAKTSQIREDYQKGLHPEGIKNAVKAILTYVTEQHR